MAGSQQVSTHDLTLDKDKVSGDSGELYLFQWLTRCEEALAQLPVDIVKSNQAELEALMTSIATAVSPFPRPGRPTRNLVARCLIILFTRAETKTLFDLLHALSRPISDPKHTETHAKISSFFIMGEIMGALGSQVMSFMGEVTISALKIAKSSNNSVQLRYHALLALSKALETSARAVTEPMVKDIMKQCKVGLADKALPVQRVSADVTRAMFSHGRAIGTVSEIENIVGTCVKGLDGADQTTRHSLASLVAYLLTFTQTEHALPSLEASSGRKGGKKDKDDGSDTETTPRVPAEAAPKTLMTPSDMMNVLCNWFNRPNVTQKMRVGIIDIYAALFTSLGPSFVEAHYALIVAHLLNGLVSHVRNTSTRFEILLVRKLVCILFRDVIGIRMLSEQGQIGAIKELSSTYLRKWPALMPGQVETSPQVLVIVLKEVSGLLRQLGNAPPPVQDALAEPLIDLLGHPNHSTRIAAAWCLRSFCYSTPLRLPKNVLLVMDLLQRDVSSLVIPSTPTDVHRRTLGHAHGLASLFSIIPERPLYVSYDLSAKVLDTAIQLLKRAGDHDLIIAGVEVETAWTCISSLMTLGPNFVRAHLSQLLVLWRNALPKPTSKDTSNGVTRSNADWTFLLRVRESALSAILSFLRHNSPVLVTLDVARRLASLLSNGLLFANLFVSQYREELIEHEVISTELSLHTREAMLRRRVFQCFSVLGFATLPESTQTTLLHSTVMLFTSPDGHSGSSAQATISTSAGTFTSIWEINQMTNMPIIGSYEHDTLVLCQARQDEPSEPPPASTGVVDAAIELFSLLLPIQDLVSASRTVTQLVEAVRSSKLERNPGRKSAVFINATYAVLLTLRNATQVNVRQARESLGSNQVAPALAEFLKDGILDGDPALRFTASEAIGRLASLAPSSFLSAQTSLLVDQVVNNRDPDGRAGCALTFGAIYSHVGGLAAGPLLKTTVNVLMSLSTDPHPMVHYWALTALGQVINAASLSYSPFLTSTLGMLVKLYMLDSHEPEGGSVINANLRGDLPAYQVMCQIIDAAIGVLGPELQDSAKIRSLTLDLVHEFSNEPDDEIRVEGIKCIQHLLIFGANFMPVAELVSSFRGNLSSSRRPLKVASINALYALVQKDAFTLSKIGGDRLVEDLFSMLDDDSSIDGVRSVITSWLQQTVSHNPSGWIDLCQRIMSRTNALQQGTVSGAKVPGALQDDEGESLSVGMAKDQPSVGQQRGSMTSRWRTQLFALQCLHIICITVASSNRQEHLDLRFARQRKFPESSLLISRVPDLIKMAFTASAAYVTEIRMEGLTVLRDIIEIFAKSPDPDYADALLLEQHQAPITAALTPAFSSDSTPEILASAIEVCAAFVGCGVVKDVGRMGRILKLLTSSLEQCKESGTLSIGDAQELSPNASVMLRVSTLTAWAELEVSSVTQTYLNAVLLPYRPTLATLWIAALRDYASIRADSEVLQESASSSMDVAYTGLGREVLLPYYTDSWAKILKAVATAMHSGDNFILAAMDGQDAQGDARVSTKGADGSLYYPIVFGLVYEALATSSTEATASSASHYIAVTALSAMRSLVRPEYSGNALFDPATFTELTGLFYRMTLTEPPEIQSLLVEVLVSIVSSRDASTLRGTVSADSRSFPEELALTHCLRVCAYILRHSITGSNRHSSLSAAAERAALIKSGFIAFMSIGGAFGPYLQEEVRAMAVHLYSELLKDEVSGVDLVGPSLPALKAMLEIKPDPNVPNQMTKYERLVHGLFSACLQNVDAMSGRHGAAPSLKVKNNLLAAVLILTVVPSSTKLSQAALEHCCYLISQKMSEGQEIAVTATHCAKTLVASAAAGNVALQHCVKYLIPGVVLYLTSVAGRNRGDGAAQSDAESDVQGVEEALKAFSVLFSSFPETSRPQALGIFLPVLVVLLNPASAPTPIHTLAVTHLLGFATSSSTAFKEATSKLGVRERGVLEASVRQAVDAMQGASSGASSNVQNAKPQISLRSF